MVMLLQAMRLQVLLTPVLSRTKSVSKDHLVARYSSCCMLCTLAAVVFASAACVHHIVQTRVILQMSKKALQDRAKEDRKKSDTGDKSKGKPKVKIDEAVDASKLSSCCACLTQMLPLYSRLKRLEVPLFPMSICCYHRRHANGQVAETRTSLWTILKSLMG